MGGAHFLQNRWSLGSQGRRDYLVTSTTICKMTIKFKNDFVKTVRTHWISEHRTGRSEEVYRAVIRTQNLYSISYLYWGELQRKGKVWPALAKQYYLFSRKWYRLVLHNRVTGKLDLIHNLIYFVHGSVDLVFMIKTIFSSTWTYIFKISNKNINSCLI